HFSDHLTQFPAVFQNRTGQQRRRSIRPYLLPAVRHKPSGRSRIFYSKSITIYTADQLFTIIKQPAAHHGNVSYLSQRSQLFCHIKRQFLLRHKSPSFCLFTCLGTNFSSVFICSTR